MLVRCGTLAPSREGAKNGFVKPKGAGDETRTRDNLLGRPKCLSAVASIAKGSILSHISWWAILRILSSYGVVNWGFIFPMSTKSVDGRLSESVDSLDNVSVTTRGFELKGLRCALYAGSDTRTRRHA